MDPNLRLKIAKSSHNGYKWINLGVGHGLYPRFLQRLHEDFVAWVGVKGRYGIVGIS